jgi:hypothetical protein
MDAPTKEDMVRDAEADVYELDRMSPYAFTADMDLEAYTRWLRDLVRVWIRRAAFAEGEIVLLRKRLKEREDYWQQRAEDTEARVKELEARVKELEKRVYGPGRFGV